MCAALKRTFCILAGLLFTAVSVLLVLLPPLDQWAGVCVRVLGIVSIAIGPCYLAIGSFGSGQRVNQAVEQILRAI